MTPSRARLLAEKITRIFEPDAILNNPQKFSLLTSLLDQAFAELDAKHQSALAEATQEALKVRDHDVKIAVDNGFKLKAEAYLDAAKMAEDSKSYKIGLCGTQQVFDHWNDAMNYITEKLRAKAGE